VRPTISPSGDSRSRAQSGTCASPQSRPFDRPGPRSSRGYLPFIQAPTDPSEDADGPPWPDGYDATVDTPITAFAVVMDEQGFRLRKGGR
jgi:hypothetical protein